MSQMKLQLQKKKSHRTQCEKAGTWCRLCHTDTLSIDHRFYLKQSRNCQFRSSQSFLGYGGSKVGKITFCHVVGDNRYFSEAPTFLDQLPKSLLSQSAEQDRHIASLPGSFPEKTFINQKIMNHISKQASTIFIIIHAFSCAPQTWTTEPLITQV